MTQLDRFQMAGGILGIYPDVQFDVKDATFGGNGGGTAISDSWKHQILFNMVKVRYGYARVFLDVSSIIGQYHIAGQINLGATFNTYPWSTSQILGTTGNYVDSPTITYNPIMGNKFARSLMAPIPPPAILSLTQAGYRVNANATA
jgi:hypothetical protein